MLFDIGSRDAAFKRITQEIRDQILTIAQAHGSHTVIPIQGSGTFAVEAALTTFIGRGDKALVCINGQYGERILTMLRRNGLAFETLVTPVTEVPDVALVADRLATDPEITHLCFVHCETTTGILNPFSALINVARANGVVTIVDSMSAFGGIAVNAQTDRFDVLISSGNKCLEAPPGLAFAIVANTLLNRKSTHATTYSLDLYDQWLSFERSGEWRTTPPTHIAQALHRALSEHSMEGTEARWARYDRVRERLTKGLRPFGITPILRQELQSPICLALQAKHWISDQESFEYFYNFLAADQIYIYAKLHAPSQTFRIGCIGQIQDDWPDRLIDRVERFAPTVARRDSSRKFACSSLSREQINA
ncbi:2-aminoethylphosphonate--pyruvate transaminase [Rhizobium beringeri]|uniref:2-aminoethylphosphonate--pyruvate transaminase n=1 Tax=Rhizobium beringeri TaxID=3019934 RepID=UPI003B5B755C